MRISLNWLKDFVDLPAEPGKLKVTLTNLGLGVESITSSDGDWILGIEVTTNRPDCLNHYGVARELATAYRLPLKKLGAVFKESATPAASEVSVEIENPDLCARYCCRIVRNIEVQPSPEWLAGRLEAAGARAINNVADITNYVLLELGHPLHAFDLSTIRQHRIVVRGARSGETLRTLDGQERKLAQENLVIADAERPVALAGIMGGENSAISGGAKSVLLESAWFDPLSVRRTAKSLGMHTEASHRFERGADIEMAPVALDRAALLVKELAGGEILRGLLDVYPRRMRREKLSLRRREIVRILGAEIVWEDVERILRSLGFVVERRGTEGWGVTPPSFRLDVTREVDLIEEVARHFGYDRLPARVLPAPPRPEDDILREKELAVARRLVELGYHEIKTSSMIDAAESALFSDLSPVELENPLSQEASSLRTSVIPSMLAALKWNLDRDCEDLRFFEIGKIYWNSSGGPRERWVLSLGLAGRRRDQTVHDDARDLDVFDLKGDLAALLDVFAIKGLRFRMATTGAGCDGPAIAGTSGPFQAGEIKRVAVGLNAEFLRGEDLLGAFGQLAGSLLATYKLRRLVWIAEIDFERLLEFSIKPKSFEPFSKFPAVQRDFSLRVPEQVSFAGITEALQQLSLPELFCFTPVELFRDGTIGPQHYSLLLRATFQSQDHTLSGEEIAAASQELLGALQPLGIRLRG